MRKRPARLVLSALFSIFLVCSGMPTLALADDDAFATDTDIPSLDQTLDTEDEPATDGNDSTAAEAAPGPESTTDEAACDSEPTVEPDVPALPEAAASTDTDVVEVTAESEPTDIEVTTDDSESAALQTTADTSDSTLQPAADPNTTSTGISIAKAKVLGIKACTYNGKAQTQKLTVKLGKKTLKKGRDYQVAYQDNINAGTATVTITGTGAYGGTITKTFKIKRKAVSKLKISSPKAQTYNGSPRTPQPVVKDGKRKLTEGVDFSLSYKKNTNAGTATVIVKGMGNYSGSVKRTFKINQRSIKSGTNISVPSSVTYNGKAQKPKPTVVFEGRTLRAGKDYTVSYSNNKKAGTAKLTIKGKGSFKGSVTKKFKITKPARQSRSSDTDVDDEDVDEDDHTDRSSRTVYITQTGSKYHRDGCRYLSRSQIPIDLDDAIAQGYDACSVCNP